LLKKKSKDEIKNSNDKTERKNEGNAKKKKEGLNWGGGCFHCSYSFFNPKNLKNQSKHLDKPINDLNKSKKLNKNSKSI